MSIICLLHFSRNLDKRVESFLKTLSKGYHENAPEWFFPINAVLELKPGTCSGDEFPLLDCMILAPRLIKS